MRYAGTSRIEEPCPGGCEHGSCARRVALAEETLCVACGEPLGYRVAVQHVATRRDRGWYHRRCVEKQLEAVGLSSVAEVPRR
ncbi:MAG TPA: hypothetical protein VEA38_20270 [Terriglobales bacterium]|nr:hypothetical protein [Terriglobales bacterium]